MKKQSFLYTFFGVVIFGVVAIFVTASQNDPKNEELDDYVQTTGETIRIKPLTQDIRKLPETVVAVKGRKTIADRSPASAYGLVRADIAAVKVKPEAVQSKANLLQAYRNELLGLKKTSSEDQRLIQDILDYVQSAPTNELPVQTTVASGGTYRLSEPINEAKIREPEIREKYRALTGVKPKIDPKKSK